MIISRNLKNRFIKDTGVPISITESPYFEQQLVDYELTHGTKTKWMNLINMIVERFEGNAEEWLAYYASVRDNIITTIENSDAYKDFNTDNFKKYTDGYVEFQNRYNRTIGDVNIYNENNVGRHFISVDLKKANFQAFNYHNPEILLNSNTYEEFIGKFTDIDYIKDSKYTRQVIFGKLNPKRQIQIEKYLLSRICMDPVLGSMEQGGAKLISFKSDELVYDVTNIDKLNFSYLSLIEQTIKDVYHVDVKVEYFKLNLFKFHDHMGHTLPVYEKEIYNLNKKELKGAVLTFYPQIHKLYNGLDVEDDDLVFYHEHQLARFMYPLTMEKQ